MEAIKQAAQILAKARHITAFTGAGISVESGIPPFRGPRGLWSKYDPVVLDLSYFRQNSHHAWQIIREIFYDFFGKARPNQAHNVLARLEKQGNLKAIITQNIDNLHQESGSTTVYEFHGTAQSLTCQQCGKNFRRRAVSFETVPVLCPECNGLLKPDFIFFGESIPQKALAASLREAEIADVFLLVGTTGEVMPASMIPPQAKQNGAKIIEVNTEESNYTRSITDVFLKGKATGVFEALEKELFQEKK